MFVVNDDMSIYLTRGDTAIFSVTADNNGKNYVFQPGDVVRIKVTEKKACENVMFQKDFPVTEEAEKVDILLTEEETKIGEVISKPTDYWYEIELNPYTNPQTIVGYDDDGAKILKLFPEGRDLEPTPVTPEDIPVVDSALSLTSDRPVQNQAIARSITGLGADIKYVRATIEGKIAAEASRRSEDVLRLENDIAAERARINNLASLEEGSTTGDAELADIRVGADGKTYTNAGEAVRGQISELSESYSEITDTLENDLLETMTIIDVDKTNYFIGSLGTDGKPYVADTNWISTEVAIFAKKGSTITVSSPTYRFCVAKYSDNTYNNNIGFSGYLDYGTTYTVAEDCYVRCAIGIKGGPASDVSYFENFAVNIVTYKSEEKAKLLEKNAEYILLRKNDVYAGNIMSLIAKRASVQAYTYVQSSKNLLKNDIELYNSQQDAFEVTTNNSNTKVRTASFAIPSAKVFTVSGIGGGYALVGVRAYDKHKALMNYGLHLSINDNGYYLIKATNKDVRYCNFVFAKTDGSVITTSEIASMQIMFEIGEEPTEYVTGIRQTTLGIAASEFDKKLNPRGMLLNNNDTVIWTEEHTILWEVEREDDLSEIVAITKDNALVKDVCLTKSYVYDWFTANHVEPFEYGITSDEYFAKLSQLCYGRSFVAEERCGKDASGTYDIYKYHIVPMKAQIPGTNMKHPKVIITACLHGYEKGSSFAVYAFMNDLLYHWEENPVLTFLRQNVEFHIFPIVNPWGFNNAKQSSEDGYTNSNNININRNFDAETPQIETQYVQEVMKNHANDCVLYMDFHTNGMTRYYTNPVEYASSNWLSTRDESPQYIFDSFYDHAIEMSWRECKRINIDTFPLAYADDGHMSGTSTAYAYKLGIPCVTFEGSHKFPFATENEFEETCQIFNEEIFVNYLGKYFVHLRDYYESI